MVSRPSLDYRLGTQAKSGAHDRSNADPGEHAGQIAYSGFIDWPIAARRIHRGQIIMSVGVRPFLAASRTLRKYEEKGNE